jgi:hypothetical protein
MCPERSLCVHASTLAAVTRVDSGRDGGQRGTADDRAGSRRLPPRVPPHPAPLPDGEAGRDRATRSRLRWALPALPESRPGCVAETWPGRHLERPWSAVRGRVGIQGEGFPRPGGILRPPCRISRLAPSATPPPSRRCSGRSGVSAVQKKSFAARTPSTVQKKASSVQKVDRTYPTLGQAEGAPVGAPLAE